MCRGGIREWYPLVKCRWFLLLPRGNCNIRGHSLSENMMVSNFHFTIGFRELHFDLLWDDGLFISPYACRTGMYPPLDQNFTTWNPALCSKRWCYAVQGSRRKGLQVSASRSLHEITFHHCIFEQKSLILAWNFTWMQWIQLYLKGHHTCMWWAALSVVWSCHLV